MSISYKNIQSPFPSQGPDYYFDLSSLKRRGGRGCTSPQLSAHRTQSELRHTLIWATPLPNLSYVAPILYKLI
jgi:hypothetical protein